MPSYKDIKGKKFGRLVALDYLHGSKSKKAKWLCLCECGNKKEVSSSNLVSGKTRSCGCLASELVTKRNTRHGMRGKKVYKTWAAMLDRCNNKNSKNYTNYGARGIGVCDEWRDFINFYKDMGDQPIGSSIERIDVDKGYYKENCIWIENKKQAANKRVFKNNTSGIKGVSVTSGVVIAHWCSNGIQHKKSFSIKKYGFELAFEKAKKERESQIYKLINDGGNYGKYR